MLTEDAPVEVFRQLSQAGLNHRPVLLTPATTHVGLGPLGILTLNVKGQAPVDAAALQTTRSLRPPGGDERGTVAPDDEPDQGTVRPSHGACAVPIGSQRQ